MINTQKIAKSLSNLAENKYMKIITDRSQLIQPVIDDFNNHWSFDLYTRKPGPAYTDEGVFQGTDLDLACFLFTLKQRGAVINIPEHYENSTPRTATEGQRVVSTENRHGPITGLISSKEKFSFGVRIYDANVMKTDDVGEYRTFHMVDMYGSWYEGCKSLEFIPTAKENKFMYENEILTDNNTLTFKNFIHPNRWVSFYGKYYVMTKVLMERLSEEAKFLRKEAAIMREAGFGKDFPPKKWPKSIIIGETESVKIDVFESEIDHPSFINEYNLKVMFPGKEGDDLLLAMEEQARKLSYTIIPRLQFATRATEYAFHFHSKNGNRKPHWIKVEWERNFKLPGKRKTWNKLKITDDISLRYRIYKKSIIVEKQT